MNLREFLEEFDFDYKVNSDGSLSLIDITGVNLGDIESERFSKPSEIVDRLSMYIADYENEGIDYLLERRHIGIDLYTATLAEKVKAAEAHNIPVYTVYYCILDPDLLHVDEWKKKQQEERK